MAFKRTEHKDEALLSPLFSEVLYEDEGFRSRQFAALVASKVFYHLGAFEESLNYALGAGDLFNVNDNSEYVETIIGKQLLLPKKMQAFVLSELSCLEISLALAVFPHIPLLVLELLLLLLLLSLFLPCFPVHFKIP